MSPLNSVCDLCVIQILGELPILLFHLKTKIVVISDVSRKFRKIKEVLIYFNFVFIRKIATRQMIYNHQGWALTS